MNDFVNCVINKKIGIKNIILLLLVVLITVIPLLAVHNAEFGGSDGEAEKAISEIKADYEPWFNPVFVPPSGEIESLLFALQAAIGAGFIGYYMGFVRGRKINPEDE